MAQNSRVKKRRLKVFTPNSKFYPRSAVHIPIVLECGKNYQIKGKGTLADHHWIIVKHNSVEYDVLLDASESKLGVFRTIEVPRKK